MQAALDLLAEGTDLATISINAIAARARVGKATIYRRWPNKDALLVDALNTLGPPLPTSLGEDVRDNLIRALTRLVTRLQDTRANLVLNAVTAAGHNYPQLRARYLADVVEPRREALRVVLRKGIADGQLRPDIDAEMIAAMLYAPLVSRAADGTLPTRPPQDIATEVVDLILTGIAAQ
jgi:AcrR family transcriptional regulator